MLEKPFLKKKQESLKEGGYNMKKKILIGSSILVVLLITSIAFAQGFNQDKSVRGPMVTPEVHEQIVQALETGDYAAWLDAHESNNLSVRPEIADLINEENFDRFVEMHSLMQAGDKEGAKEIADELGLAGPMFKQGPRGMGQGPMNGSGQGFRGQQGQRNMANCPNQ